MVDIDDQEPQIYGVIESPKPRNKRGFSAKTLTAELEQKGFDDISPDVIYEYGRIVAGSNYQQNKRKGLLYACILRVYRDKKRPFDLDTIRKKMGITKAVASKGLKLYYLHASTLDKNIDRLECMPVDYANLLLDQLVSRDDWYDRNKKDKVKRLADDSIDLDVVQGCITSVLNYISQPNVFSLTKNSTLKCIAAAVVYYHFIACNIGIKKDIYTKICDCSFASIEKLYEDICRILKAYQISLKKVKS